MSRIVQFPSGTQYREALQNTLFCFQDPDLRGGTPELDPLGLPRPISGNFASVFNIAGHDGRRWAVKCFTRYAEDQERRYAAISHHLAQLSYPWKVSFEFLHSGVRIQGNQWYPCLKMEWIQATGLARFIETHLWEPAVLATVAKCFADMVAELAAAGIAHGDLQHGNILVAPDGRLKLIDYDGMFVRGLEVFGANEKGHVNYQSPERSLNQWGAELDRFSAWVIYLSLVALTLDPTLWSRLRADGDECLLFRSDDYVDPATSQALLAFQTSGNDQLRALASVVERLWSTDLQSLPPLRPQDAPTPAITSTMAGAMPGTGAPAATSLPSWVPAAGTASTRPPTDLPAEPIPANPGAWLSGHISPLSPVQFTSSAANARLAAAFVLLALAAALAGSFTGALPAAAAPVSAVLGVVVFLLIESLLYQRTPEQQARFEKRALFSKRQGDFNIAQRGLNKLVQDRQRLDTNEKRDCERVTKRQDEARRTEQSELGKITADLSRRMDDITARQRSLQAAESRERGNALRLLQDQHVQAQLAAHRVGSRKLAGIGDKLISNLNRYGIRTAADFTGVSMSQSYSGRYPREVAHIHLRTSRAVHVEGIGPEKAWTLDRWRQSLESQARASQPTRLPTAQDRAIVQKYTTQRQSLANEEQTARAEATRRSSDVRQRWQTTQAELLRQLQAIRQRAAQSRAALDRQITEARREASSADWRLALARRELDAYARVRYRNYLKRIVAG
jgi:Protein kinase domain